MFSLSLQCVEASSLCLSILRKEEIQNRLEFLETRSSSPKKRGTRVHYPKDFVEGEERDLIVYMHGFGANEDSYFKKTEAAPSVQEKISALYETKKAREPVVLSFSMGPSTIAGVYEHGADHRFFLPVEDFWSALELSISELPMSPRKIFFLANSAGAFSVFQMLRHQSEGIHVNAAVLCALPHFTSNGFDANPALQADGTDLDPSGTYLRGAIEPIVADLLKDSHIEQLMPRGALNDNTLSMQTPILIQGGTWDALGYTALNARFVEEAAERGYPISMAEISGGHASGNDNNLTVDFFLRAP